MAKDRATFIETTGATAAGGEIEATTHAPISSILRDGDLTAVHPAPPRVESPNLGEGTVVGIANPSTLAGASQECQSSAQRYQALRSLARGGLGEVYVARDRELPREVVLKEIQHRHLADQSSIDRFVLEAEITGALEHPGIVPIYGFGRYSDGRPYYAMRFVRGETLAEAAGKFHAGKRIVEWRRDVVFRDLLQRFVAVCYAMEFAHRRGVIHRDLKPSNIMVGQHGETLVVDWGLAKRIGQTASAESRGRQTACDVDLAAACQFATECGSVLGTPSYMSPEQASGHLEDVGIPSDIYGLGATLYFLLTSRPPVSDDDLLLTIAKAQRGDFPAPRQVNPRIPAALNAICLRAVSLLPERRYASAVDIANDINRWLADEPVAAYLEPWTLRMGRWVRRHRTLVTTASVSVGIAAILATGAAFMLNSARRSEKTAREFAERNQNRALAAEAKAEERFQQAQQAVDDSFTEISESPIWLKQTPGTQELRRRLLERAKAYYEKFAAEKSADPSVRRATANANMRLGQVLRDLSPAAANAEPFERALSLWAALLDEHPSDASIALNLARTENALGRIRVQHGAADRARQSFEAALAWSQKSLAIDARNPETTLESAAARANLGYLEGNSGQLPRSLKTLDAARTELLPLLSGDSSSAVRALRQLSDVDARIGFALQQQDRLEEAAQAYASSVDSTRRVLAKHPDDVEVQAELGARIMSQAQLLRYRGFRAEALRLAVEAAGNYEKLARENPQVRRFPQAFAKANVFTAFILMDQGQFDEARRRLDLAEKQYTALIAEFPTVVEHRADLGGLYNNIAEHHARQGRIEQALSYFERSVVEFAKVFALQPRHVPAERTLNYAHMNRVSWALQKGRGAAALEFLDRRLRAPDLSDFERGVCRHWRAYVWAHGAEHARAVREAEALAVESTANAEQLYNLACVLSVAGSSASKDAALTPANRKSVAENAARKAMELLDRSRRKGFFAMPEGLGDLKKDPDLNPLRSRDDFRRLLEAVDQPQRK